MKLNSIKFKFKLLVIITNYWNNMFSVKTIIFKIYCIFGVTQQHEGNIKEIILYIIIL